MEETCPGSLKSSNSQELRDLRWCRTISINSTSTRLTKHITLLPCAKPGTANACQNWKTPIAQSPRSKYLITNSGAPNKKGSEQEFARLMSTGLHACYLGDWSPRLISLEPLPYTRTHLTCRTQSAFGSLTTFFSTSFFSMPSFLSNRLIWPWKRSSSIQPWMNAHGVFKNLESRRGINCPTCVMLKLYPLEEGGHVANPSAQPKRRAMACSHVPQSH